jgi:gas vesicle protein
MGGGHWCRGRNSFSGADMNLSLGEILGFSVAVIGGVWGIISTLLSRDRKSIDDRAEALEKSYKETRTKMWEKIDLHAKEIAHLELALTEIKGRINALPDAASINSTLSQFENKVEKRLDSLSKQLQELVSAVINFKKGGA